MNFHKILLKFTKIRMDFQLTNFFGEFYIIFSLSVPASAESYFLSHFLSNTDFAKPWKSTCLVEFAYQKQHHSMPYDVPVRPPTRYSLDPRETGSTLFQSQFHSTIGRYAYAYIRKPADETDVIFSWTTEPYLNSNFLSKLIIFPLVEKPPQPAISQAKQ
jgi:hypothetical protein